MAGLRFSDLQARPTELLDLTSLTGEEVHCLVPAFETAFHTRRATWRLEGKPRTTRRFTVYQACPLPTPEDRLLFSLVSLKTYALQVGPGRLFGLGQSKANQWIHVLLPVLRAARAALGDTPTRALPAVAQRLGLAEGEAVALVVPEEPAPRRVAAEVAAPAAAPLLPLRAPNGGSVAPKIRLSRGGVRAARRSATP